MTETAVLICDDFERHTSAVGMSRAHVGDRLARVASGFTVLWEADDDADAPLHSVEILVTAKHEVDRELLERLPALRMISCAFTGYDGVDLAYCRDRDIRPYYVPHYATDSVAELIVGLTITELRKIVLADASTRRGDWHDTVYPGTELAGKTVGIVGTGTIGLRAAELFAAFRCSLLGWSRTERKEFITVSGTYVALDDLLERANIVVLAVPLSSATEHLIGEDRLRRMRTGALLVNVARSRLVDQSALREVLAEGRIATAIDVFDHDPVVLTETGKPTEQAKLVGAAGLVTPHIGFKTREALLRLIEATIDNIAVFLAGGNRNSVFALEEEPTVTLQPQPRATPKGRRVPDRKRRSEKRDSQP
jgi:D-3-phosphoglycerate dehydrogenase / 2-oxoglutarate reductase